MLKKTAPGAWHGTPGFAACLAHSPMASIMMSGAHGSAACTSELIVHPVVMMTSGVTERQRPAALAAVGLVAFVAGGVTDPWTPYPLVPTLGTDARSPGPTTGPPGSPAVPLAAGGDPEQGQDHRGLAGPAPTSAVAPTAAPGTPRAAASALAAPMGRALEVGGVWPGCSTGDRCPLARQAPCPLMPRGQAFQQAPPFLAEHGRYGS